MTVMVSLSLIRLAKMPLSLVAVTTTAKEIPMAIENIYRVTVSMVGDVPPQHPEYSRAVGGHDILGEIVIRTELDKEFEKDFIKATNKSIDAQTDGYNGAMIADFTSLEDAEEAEGMMIEVSTKYEKLVVDVLRKEHDEFYEDE
jgi:hypothetical protein